VSDGGTDAKRGQTWAETREEREKALPDFIEGFRYPAGDLITLIKDYWSERETLLGIDDRDHERNPSLRQRSMTRLEERKPNLIKQLRQLADDLEKKF
jgi:hypothetical protein